ncbi:Ribonuclease J (endonuclease and 5' exonuclease) [hydrothermal vent metagenome]|uniref:Ribonuclease J (Endonuclease and 5' exonuclease) n=1 Tax=hydrothermal vent metagenome TaxID=652676 RepID=A0A3B0TH88_9ZZZZ
MNARSNPGELVYAPLGGAGEIGMNLYLYGTGTEKKREWIVVDVGIGFTGGQLPGVDVVLPDTAHIEALGSAVKAIVLTHAHEDHYGAVAELWRRLKLPVYATPFTAELLKGKLYEHGLEDQVPLNVLGLGSPFKIGAFELEFVTMTHSIPEPSGLIIRTGAGTVLHTGDWKLDAEPVISPNTDLDKLTALGEAGCDAMVCDSTNVFRDGVSASEAEVARSLTKIIASAEHRVAVTTFSSNVGRIISLVRAGQEAGRDIVLAGRALHRITAAAEATGYLTGAGKLLDARDFADVPRHRCLAIVTGSQGEPRAALSRIATGTHPNIRLEPDDLVIYSSKNIPGNELAIAQVENRLAEMGVKIINSDRHLVHVTGHPRRGELKAMYEMVKPKLAVPMHGEYRHLTEHAAFARELGVPQSLVVPNGSLARLVPGPGQVIGEVSAGRLLRDGEILVPESDPAVRERRSLSFAGAVFISMVLDENSGELASDTEIHLLGIPEPTDHGPDLDELVENAIDKAMKKLPRARRRDPDHVAEMVRRSVRGVLRQAWGKKPETRVAVAHVRLARR